MCFRESCNRDSDCCMRYNLCDKSAKVCVDCWYGSICRTEQDCCQRFPHCKRPVKPPTPGILEDIPNGKCVGKEWRIGDHHPSQPSEDYSSHVTLFTFSWLHHDAIVTSCRCLHSKNISWNVSFVFFTRILLIVMSVRQSIGCWMRSSYTLKIQQHLQNPEASISRKTGSCNLPKSISNIELSISTLLIVIQITIKTAKQFPVVRMVTWWALKYLTCDSFCSACTEDLRFPRLSFFAPATSKDKAIDRGWNRQFNSLFALAYNEILFGRLQQESSNKCCPIRRGDGSRNRFTC